MPLVVTNWLIDKSALVRLARSPCWSWRPQRWPNGPVLHVDNDFELIATLTGQSIERLILP